MPLKLNAGLSRKVADGHYGSRGASVNVELELESSLIGEPAKLQERIRQLFGLVRTALTDELNGNGHVLSAEQADGPPHPAPATPDHSTSRNSGPRPATPSQVKAIYAIARSQHIDVGPFLMERHHVGRPDELTIQQASQVIDELKGNPQERWSA
jgi:hypothetical protein